MEPPLIRTMRTVKRIGPLKLGIVSSVFHGIMGLLIIPFFLIMSFAATRLPAQQRVGFMALGAGFAFVVPIFYAVLGFVLGVLGGFVYNVVAKWTGGIEVEVE